MPDPYPFAADYSRHNISATYTFTTSRDLSYRIYFIDVTKIIEIFDEYPVISNGVYLGVDLLTPQKALFDSKTGVTIAHIVRDYLNQYGKYTILVYNCDEKDGKQAKRKEKFRRWYNDYLSDLDFEVFNKEILEEESGVFIAQYLTLLYSKDHPRLKIIRSEIDDISQWFDEEKNE